VHGVYGAHDGDIVKDDLVGTDADYGAVDFEEFLDSLALLMAEYVCCEPSGIPTWRIWDYTEERTSS